MFHFHFIKTKNKGNSVKVILYNSYKVSLHQQFTKASIATCEAWLDIHSVSRNKDSLPNLQTSTDKKLSLLSHE